MERMNNNMNSNGGGNDDGSLSFLRLPKAEGRKSFHCDKMTQQLCFGGGVHEVNGFVARVA